MHDHDTLVALNRDYIDSVQNGDVKRFDEILRRTFFAATRMARSSTGPAS
ncbi:MAG: hypothetical protein WCF47_21980 [Pseudolabrys sp.]